MLPVCSVLRFSMLIIPLTNNGYPIAAYLTPLLAWHGIFYYQDVSPRVTVFFHNAGSCDGILYMCCLGGVVNVA